MSQGDTGLFKRVPWQERSKTNRRTAKLWWHRLLYGTWPDAEPAFLGLVEDPEPDKTGICCSGGGIRSAAYNLGALQELQHARVLQNAKYVSAVSGGSYIAGAFAMVAKTWTPQPGGGPPPDSDDSDPALVTEEHPPFERGSPEEQYLRNHSSYMAPAGVARLRALGRIVFGLAVNLLMIASVIVLLATPLALYYREAHPKLATDTEGRFTASPDETLLWVILGLVVVAVALGFLAVMIPSAKERARLFLENWSIGLLGLAGLLFLVEVIIPEVLEALGRKGTDTDDQLYRDTLPETLATIGASAGTVLVAVLFELRGRARDDQVLRKDATRIAKAVKRVTPRVRVAVAYLVAGLVGPILVAAVVLGALVIMLGPVAMPWTLTVVAAVFLAFMFLGVADPSRWSLHPFYRSRLCSAFGLKRVAGADGRPRAVPRRAGAFVPLSQSGVEPGPGWARKDWPTLLVCAAANVSDSGATPPGRQVSSFTFSPAAVGGPLVGGVETSKFEECLGRRTQDYTLPAAIAVSGAAVSPSMGKMTRRSVRFLLGLANVRLGVWIPNPARFETFIKAGSLSGLDEQECAQVFQAAEGRPALTRPRPRPHYLFFELLGLNSVRARYLYVTDGGHYENLGLVELLRRGCTRIYCFDASGGRTLSNLGDAIALARSELRVEIDIHPADLDEDPETGLATKAVVRGSITYPDRTSGELIYARTVLTPDVPFDVRAFSQVDPDFPHHSTGDQLYTDQKFEAYRALGAHAARHAIGRVTFDSGFSGGGETSGNGAAVLPARDPRAS